MKKYTVSGPRYHMMFFVMHQAGDMEIIDGIYPSWRKAYRLARRLNMRAETEQAIPAQFDRLAA